MAKRMNGRVFLDAALLHSRLEGLLQGGRVDVTGVAAREEIAFGTKLFPVGTQQF